MAAYPIRFTRNFLFIPLLLLALALFLPSPAQTETILFMDDFKDGTADNWEVIDFGEFEIVDETFCFQTI